MTGLDRALAWARDVLANADKWYPEESVIVAARVLLAEHERAERVTAERELYRNHGIRVEQQAMANAAEARRWKTIAGMALIPIESLRLYRENAPVDAARILAPSIWAEFDAAARAAADALAERSEDPVADKQKATHE